MEKDKTKITGQPEQDKVLEPAPSLKGPNPTPLDGETPQPKAGDALEEKPEGNAKNPGEGNGETKEKRKAYTSGPEKIRDEAEVEYQEAKGEKAKALIKAKMEKVVKYISEKCKADPEYNALVIQDHKTWKRCEQFMLEKVKKAACAQYGMMMVDDSICFEWMDEYYQADDLAEVKAAEEEARKEAERKERLKKEEAKRAAKAKRKPAKAVPRPEKKEEEPKQQPKPKKNNGDIDGQMDLFSMMGM